MTGPLIGTDGRIVVKPVPGNDTAPKPPPCVHEWARAPECDHLKGMFPTRSIEMVFWCRRCTAVKSTRFEVSP